MENIVLNVKINKTTQKMNKKITCPYKATNNGTCSHKHGTKNRRIKRICIFKNQANCPLFSEWLKLHRENQLKSQEDALKCKTSPSQD